MYNSGHQPGHGNRLNGNPAGRGMPQQMLYSYGGTAHNHGGHSGHAHGIQPEHASHGGSSSAMGHHGIYGSSVIGNASPFTNGMQNGHGASNRGSQPTAMNEHWQQQLKLYKAAEEANTAMVEHNQVNYFARLKAGDNKGIGGPATTGSLTTVTTGDDAEDIRRPVAVEKATKRQDWHNLDLSGQGLRALSPQLFQYEFLRELYIASNKLTTLPQAIGQLRQLHYLEVSHNELQELPAELGMCTFLKDLLLFDNHIRDLPYELGSLHQLEVLGIEGNPLNSALKNEIREKGTKSLITLLREQSPVPMPPAPRKMVVIQEDLSPSLERVKVFSWNILCDRYATSQMYGYTPSSALTWEYRKDLMMDEFRRRDADFLCLQEINTEALRENFAPELAREDYKFIHWPRSKARTMSEREANLVDGCAIFYKQSKFILLDKQLIDLQTIAINKPDLKTQHDVFNRVMPKDNIAVVGFFESRATGARIIVVNAHLAWEAHLADVKVVQTALILEQVTKQAEKYTRWPACKDKKLFELANDSPDTPPKSPPPEPAPSQEYRNNTDIPLFICGDYNAVVGSGVDTLVTTGRLSKDHPEIVNHKYGNFTNVGIEHPFSLRSSYHPLAGTPDELPFTNYTPGFTGVIDHIWYSTNTLEVVELLGPPEVDYLKRVPGFPNYHFPADHIEIMGDFVIKARKDGKKGGGP